MAERKRSRGPGDDDDRPNKRLRAPGSPGPSVEVVVLEDESSDGEWVEPAPGPADGGATPPPVGILREVSRGLYRGGCLIQGEPAPGVQEALVDIPDVPEVGPPAPDVPMALVEVPGAPPVDFPGEPAPGVQLDLVEVPDEPQAEGPPVVGPVNDHPIAPGNIPPAPLDQPGQADGANIDRNARRIADKKAYAHRLWHNKKLKRLRKNANRKK